MKAYKTITRKILFPLAMSMRIDKFLHRISALFFDLGMVALLN